MPPEGIDLNALEFVGKGSQGRVYRIDDKRCIKIYDRVELLPAELEVLLRAENEPQFPKVCEWGEDYMIREYVDGLGLKEYLRKHPWTEDLSRQLVELFQAFERLGFRRLDTRMAHLIVTPEGRLMAIDPANAMRKSGAYPRKLLSQLAKMKYQRTFFQHLQRINPELYRRWA